MPRVLSVNEWGRGGLLLTYTSYIYTTVAFKVVHHDTRVNLTDIWGITTSLRDSKVVELDAK